MISTAIGAARPGDRVPIVAVFGVTAAIGLTVLLTGRQRAEASPVAEEPAPPAVSEPACRHDTVAGECEVCRV